MTAEDLRQLVWQAAVVGDDALETVCRAHEADVRTHFVAWQKVPDAIRPSPPETERYVATMVRIAEMFATRLGQPELLQRLRGDESNNPLVKWQKALDDARAEMEKLRFAETAARLTDLLIDVRGLKGSGVAAYLPVTFGSLGECYFQSGDAPKALEPTRAALDLCTRQNDREGMAAYLGNLYEIHRYLDQKEDAATTAERLADVLADTQPEEATRYRQQAKLVRAGEPLNRVIVGVEGRRMELDDLCARGGTGRVQFAFERNRLELRPCQVLTAQGEKQATAGRFESALQTFRSAAAADRYSPQPHYQAGLTLLYLQRYGEALESYETTEALAPGWFHCRSDLWLTQRLLLGTVPHEVFLIVRELEDGSRPPAEKARLAHKALATTALTPQLHLGLGKALKALQQAKEAETALRAGLTCASDEPDTRTRLLVELGSVVADDNERRDLLTEARQLKGNLVAAATAAVVLAFAE